MIELRMNAYYYSFDGTGEPVIDRILSAVACAGKAEHHTQYWSDDHEPYEGHAGDTCVDWIQTAAVDAASELKTLRNSEDLKRLGRVKDSGHVEWLVEKLKRDLRPRYAAFSVFEAQVRALDELIALLQPAEEGP